MASASAIKKSLNVLVNICNEDASPISAPAYSFCTRISISSGLAFSGITNTDGSVLKGWDMLKDCTAGATEIELTNALPLLNGECFSISIMLNAAKSTDSLTVVTQLVFSTKLNGNNLINDVSISRLISNQQKNAIGEKERPGTYPESTKFPNH
jgi:hypothetical protein